LKNWLRALKGTRVRRPIRRRPNPFFRPSLGVLEERITPVDPATDNIQSFVYVDIHNSGRP